MITIEEHRPRRHSAAGWLWSFLLLTACSLTEPGRPSIPVDSLGTLVQGVSSACPNYSTPYAQCFAWSSDGARLFAVVVEGRDTLLFGVYVAALTNPVFAIGPSTVRFPLGRSLNIATSRDPKAIFLTRPDTVGPFPFEVLRMSLVDGKMTRVTGAAAPDISVTPDGTGVVYHAFRSSAVDTVALIDATSGVRRAQTVGFQSLLRGISPDGQDVAIMASVGDSAVIWHSATGVRQPAKYGADFTSGTGLRHTRDLQWTNGGFSTLYQSEAGELMEISASTGAAVSYGRHGRWLGTVAWSPAVSRVFTSEIEGGCYPDPSCYIPMYHSSLMVSSASGVRTIGSVNREFFATGPDGNSFSQFVPSPDGRWLAYVVYGGGYVFLAAAQ